MNDAELIYPYTVVSKQDIIELNLAPIVVSYISFHLKVRGISKDVFYESCASTDLMPTLEMLIKTFLLNTDLDVNLTIEDYWSLIMEFEHHLTL